MTGTKNFRKDKVLQHHKSKQHNLALQISRNCFDTPEDLLEPVSLAWDEVGAESNTFENHIYEFCIVSLKKCYYGKTA